MGAAGRAPIPSLVVTGGLSFSGPSGWILGPEEPRELDRFSETGAGSPCVNHGVCSHGCALRGLPASPLPLLAAATQAPGLRETPRTEHPPPVPSPP